ncbi:MAG: hypothetical protein IJP66_01005, partial [Kiritimatiellae bacterium]|nr:hypothetical protein [Kiritimatiellia bacterium]
ERSNEDTEFKAKKEQELSEYIKQLAQEKGIAEIDRAEELEIVRKVSQGNISAKEAQLALARLQEGHARQMAELANKLELDLTMSNYDREEQLRKARHAAQLGDIAREEAVKDAKNATIIHAEENKRRKDDIDTDIHEATEWIKVKDQKQKVELEAKAREADIQAKADADRARTIKGMSALEMAALDKDPAARADFLKYAGELLKKDMTPEQTLATLSANASSAEALKAMYESKDKATQALLDELRKIYDSSLGRDDRMNERYAEVLEKVSKMMSDTASAAARRVDNAPTPPATQQIFK